MFLNKKNLFLFACFCLFIQTLPSLSLAQTSTQPATKASIDSAGGGAGSGSGTATPDLFSGTMRYSIPIDVPAGRKGMQPNLALTYSSNNGNGWVGVGWDLEIGAIERSARNGIDYTGNEFILRMAGAAIDLVHIGNDEFGNNVYRAKIENSFVRVKKLTTTNGTYWEATDRAGTKYFYGQTDASFQDDPANASKIFKWCLDKVEDTNGNYMNIFYTKDQGQIYPDRIDYAGNGALQPTSYVKFYTEGRTDAPDMYATNFKVKTALRLKSISVTAKGQYPDGSSVRTYKLTYASSASTSRSLLSGVQQFGKDAMVDATNGTITNEAVASKLPTITFLAQDGGTGNLIMNPYQDRPETGWGGYTAMVGDVNGDGQSDMIWNALIPGGANQTYVGISKGDGTFDMKPGQARSETGWGGYTAMVGDVNGDGKSDMIWNALIPGGANQTYVGISKGDGTFDMKPGQARSETGWGGYTAMVGDVNGDGRSDMIWNALTCNSP